jgi:hypothetical protein
MDPCDFILPCDCCDFTFFPLPLRSSSFDVLGVLFFIDLFVEESDFIDGACDGETVEAEAPISSVSQNSYSSPSYYVFF